MPIFTGLGYVYLDAVFDSGLDYSDRDGTLLLGGISKDNR